MIRRIGKCLDCKQVSAKDYTAATVVRRGVGMYARNSTVFGLASPNGFKLASDDSTCPRCDGKRWNAKRIMGGTTAHVCGPRCTAAKGWLCECSCGGVNHGSARLVCA